MLPETRDVYELEKLWTLRRYDEQLMRIPAETLPEDFMYDVEVTKWQQKTKSEYYADLKRHLFTLDISFNLSRVLAGLNWGSCEW